ncbi:MAG: glycosyltransferase family 2 protein [Minisyncoccia bacterium]
MGTEMLGYPFLFIAIYFEAFVLVTLLSKPAHAMRTRTPGAETPTVAIIVPVWNEATTVRGTYESLLALDYPKDKLEIIFVNDGSTDGTDKVLSNFETNPQVRIIHKENGGKHTAVNAGLALTNAEFIGCLDADSYVAPDALREILPSFSNPRVAATTAAMSIYEPKNLLEHMQNAEYIFGITLRHAMAAVNGIYVTPGPFSFYRASVLKELGGFRKGHQAEDMEMALRIQRAGYEIENAPRARVYTKPPRTVRKLVKQRVRWTTGFLRNVLGEYRELIGSKKNGALGFLVLPVALFAILGGILLFLLMLFKFVQNAISSIEIHAGIPLSYSLIPHGTFDWLSVPINFLLLLGLVTLVSSLVLTVVGKKLSKTPGNIIPGLISYTILYGLIAPLWLIRSTVDVAFGKRRPWR